MQGTIPYLGTFLTDLTMLDTALPDIVEVNKTKSTSRFRPSTVCCEWTEPSRCDVGACVAAVPIGELHLTLFVWAVAGMWCPQVLTVRSLCLCVHRGACSTLRRDAGWGSHLFIGWHKGSKWLFWCEAFFCLWWPSLCPSVSAGVWGDRPDQAAPVGL